MFMLYCSNALCIYSFFFHFIIFMFLFYFFFFFIVIFYMLFFFFFFFFFQAEDGIRDGTVTGVQTCALPICARAAVYTPHMRLSKETIMHGIIESLSPEHAQIDWKWVGSVFVFYVVDRKSVV